MGLHVVEKCHSEIETLFPDCSLPCLQLIFYLEVGMTRHSGSMHYHKSLSAIRFSCHEKGCFPCAGLQMALSHHVQSFPYNSYKLLLFRLAILFQMVPLDYAMTLKERTQLVLHPY